MKRTRDYGPSHRPAYIQTGNVRSWCYICSTIHRWSEACPPVDKARIPGRYLVREGAKR